MRFRDWLEMTEADFYQKMFPFATEEDPPDLKRIKRFKSQNNYVQAMSRGGRETEGAAQKLISAPAGHWIVGGGSEEIVELVPNAFTIPASTFTDGSPRPQYNLAFVHLRTTEPANPNHPKYNKPRHRILAYWQGQRPTFSKEEVFDQLNQPIGGVSFMGNYIDTVWISPEYRGSANMPSLYKALREFAKRRGAANLEPGDDLTSSSYRAAQAKYDWKRAQEMLQ